MAAAGRPDSRMSRRLLAIVVSGWLAVACHVTARHSVSTAVAGPSATASSQYRLVAEPGDGMAGLYRLMSSPASTLDMTMYELVDTQAEMLLAADAARGVKVRVVLDGNREAKANGPAFTFLAAHGVQVRWAAPRYRATHQKTIVIDGKTAAILTLNLTSRYYPATRDFAVIDSNPADVAAVETVFAADFAGRPVTAGPAGDDLVWSPGSQPQLVALIDSARSTLAVENEEMAAPAIVAALSAAARRGVRVEVTMTDSPDWAKEFAVLIGAGVRVRAYHGEHPIYIHAKAIVVDAGIRAARVFVGSENFTGASMDQNRELGVIVGSPTVVGPVSAILADDFAGATPWQAA